MIKTFAFALVAAAALTASLSSAQVQQFPNVGDRQFGIGPDTDNIGDFPRFPRFPRFQQSPQLGPVVNGFPQVVPNAGVFPQTGAGAGNGIQPGDINTLPEEQLEQAPNVTAPPAGVQPATTPTSVPGAAAAASTSGDQLAAQPTIMVLLPDFLAPTSSGSSDTMVVAGLDGSTSSAASAAKDATDAAATSASVAVRSGAAAVAMLSVAALALF